MNSYGKHYIQNMPERLYTALSPGVTLLVVFLTLVYESFYWLEIVSNVSNKAVETPQYILYFGTFVTLFINELIYEPFTEKMGSHWLIVTTAFVCMLISLIGYPCKEFIADHFTTCLTGYFVACKVIYFIGYSILTVAYTEKNAHIWRS